jgi:hypothetical protein
MAPAESSMAASANRRKRRYRTERHRDNQSNRSSQLQKSAFHNHLQTTLS